VPRGRTADRRATPDARSRSCPSHRALRVDIRAPPRRSRRSAQAGAACAESASAVRGRSRAADVSAPPLPFAATLIARRPVRRLQSSHRRVRTSRESGRRPPQ
jgi:hypothetical protein